MPGVHQQSCYTLHSHFSVCTKGHPLAKELKGSNRYYNCIYCKRYNINEPSFYCYSCEKAGCLSCCQEKNDEELGKNDFE